MFGKKYACRNTKHWINKETWMDSVDTQTNRLIQSCNIMIDSSWMIIE